MRYMSVASGIESASAAWHMLGWQPAVFSEIDDFARSVLTFHYPRVPLHGDFTTIQTEEYGKISLLVGGTPCQDFSVAGLRAGALGARGNLTFQFLRLASREKPDWIVWENVPGVLSIDEGRTFGAFLGGLAQLGYGFAYRILDAQYFKLAQQRRRVFVIGYLGDWRRAAAVLFESESLRWSSPPRRETKKKTTSSTILCAERRSGENMIAKCITTNEARFDGETSTLIPIESNLENYCVRRLTPKECERLQGFPDDYTNIPWRGKTTAPDARRYKALGNSMAVPVMKWIGQRINLIENM